MRARTAAAGMALLGKRVGYRKAAVLASFLMEWAYTLDLHDWDEQMAGERVREEFGYAQGTFYRRMDLFKKAFPDERTPSRLLVAQHIEQQTNDVDEVVAAVASLGAAAA